MKVTRRQFTAAAASILACAPLGCATTPDKTLLSGKTQEKSLLDRLPLLGRKKDKTPEPYPNPVKLAATWTPDTLVQMGARRLVGSEDGFSFTTKNRDRFPSTEH